MSSQPVITQTAQPLQDFIDAPQVFDQPESVMRGRFKEEPELRRNIRNRFDLSRFGR